MSLSTPSEDLGFIVTNEPGKGSYRNSLALCRGGVSWGQRSVGRGCRRQGAMGISES